MGSLLVVTGPPGAGKSVVSRVIADRLEHSVVVVGDVFFSFLAGGTIQPWLPEAHEQNGVIVDAAGAATGRLVGAGYAAVYDGVLGPWFVPRFAAAAAVGRLDYALLLPPVAVCVERVRARHDQGFSDAAVTRRLHGEFAGAAIPLRHVIDSCEKPATVAALVLRAQHHRDLVYEVE